MNESEGTRRRKFRKRLENIFDFAAAHRIDEIYYFFDFIITFAAGFFIFLKRKKPNVINLNLQLIAAKLK